MSEEDYQALRQALVDERIKYEDLAQSLNKKDRDYTEQLQVFQALLAAEQQKNLALKASIGQNKPDKSRPPQDDSQALAHKTTRQDLKEREEAAMTRETVITPSIERAVQELEEINHKLVAENRQLVAQQTDIAEAAVRPM